MRTAQPLWRGLTAASLAVLAAGAATLTDRAQAVATTPLTSTVVVSGAGAYVQDVNLTTRITHPHTNDLRIHLTSPSGTRVPISTRSPALDGTNLQTNVFDGTVWDDAAGDPVTDHVFGAGAAVTLTPEGALSAFVGEPANGTWTLTVVDEDPVMEGTLTGFDLEVVTLATAPTFGAPALRTSESVLSIEDSPEPGVPGTPTTSSVTVNASANIWAQDVELTPTIDHPRSGDLTIELTSPAGTTEVISSRNGGDTNAFNGLKFDDAAGTPETRPVTDETFSPPPTSLVPEGALGAFIGENPTGTWTVRVTDHVPGNAGQIHGFELLIKRLPSAPSTTTRTVTSAGGPRVIPDAQPDPVAPPSTDPVTPDPVTPDPVTPDPVVPGVPGLAPVAPAPTAPGTTPGTTPPAPRGGARAPRLLGVSAPTLLRLGARARIVARFTTAPAGPVELQRSMPGGFRTVARARVRNGRAALTYAPRQAGRHVLRLRWRVPGGARAGAPITLRVRP